MQTLDHPDSADFPALAIPRVAAWRILIGLLQGVLLYAVYRAVQQQALPATEPLLFAPLALAGLLVPPILISSLGHMAPRQLLLWGAVSVLVLAGLGCYDAWRVADLPLRMGGPIPGPGPQRQPFPSPVLAAFCAAGFFIAHALVLSAVRERRRIAAYPTYFDTAWKLGVQLAFSGLFTGVSWLVLLLGAQLFELVKLSFLTKLIREQWFAIPVTAFAFACAMHLTDVRPAIVRGIRGLLLVLLSWLLPVTVLLVGGFLATLPFTGLAPLWATRHAASVLLCAAAAFVVLINAAWQDGEAATVLTAGAPAVSTVVRVAARIGALLLAPLVAIAIYALVLRVRDYGWTAERVGAAACMLVAACYALGYFWAALRPGWLPLLSRVNISAAFVVLGALLALFSPLLDPARISVDSQLARLAAGKVKAERFDFVFLRFDGERFGRAALDQLERTASGADASLVRRQVAAVRKLENRWNRDEMTPQAVDLAANLIVRGQGTRLPESFLRTDWRLKDKGYLYPDCLRHPGKQCDAFMLDVTGDGKPEVLLVRSKPADAVIAGGHDTLVLAEDAQGQWMALATLALPSVDCNALRGSLAAGKVGAVAATLADIEIGGLRVPLAPVESGGGCRPRPR
jgi:hypothetical protein